MTGADRIHRRVLVAAVWALLPAAAAPAAELFDEPARQFAARVDMRGWELLPVQHGGRLKILDTVARRQLSFFHGRRSIDGTSATFSFLELYFNAGAYLKRPVIRLGDGRLRNALRPGMPAEAVEMLETTGRLAPIDLLNVAARRLLLNSGRASREQLDRKRLDSLAGALGAAGRAGPATGKAARRLLSRMEAFLAVDALRIIPPPGGTDAYLTPEENAEVAAGRSGRSAVTASEAAEVDVLFAALGGAWRRRDVKLVNALSAELFGRLAGRAGTACPPLWRRGLERFHNRLLGFTIGWIGFFLAAVLLLGSLAAGRRRALIRRAGVVVFGVSTGFLVAGMIVRWIISGRGWHLPPLTNQYESVLGVALMAAVVGGLLELLFRKGTLALAASIVAAAALLCAFFQLGPLQPDINAPMAVLNTSILAWHVATLIIGYGMIGMSVVVSVAYLAIALGKLGAGAAAPPAIAPDLSGPAPAEGNTLAELDRYNLILLQLACWLIAIGDVLGAYWADRAWGRWWGWDAKETWGLMTLLVFLGIIHVRYVLPARSRGLWTAALSIFGCAVMAFTWWGVNYLLRGLHSYA